MKMGMTVDVPRWWRTLVAQGEKHGSTPREARRIRILNAVAIVLSVVTAPYALIFYLMDARMLGLLVLPIAGFYALPPLLNRRGHFTASRLLVFTVFNGAITLYTAWMGLATGIGLLYFASACLPLVLCDLRERALLVYGIALPIAACFGLVVVGAPPVDPLPEAVSHVLHALLVPTTFAILLSQVLSFAVSNARAERALDVRNRGLRLLLDSTDQGFLRLDAEGRVRPERSAAVDALLGPVSPGTSFADALGGEVGAQFECGWAQVGAGILPLDVALDQLPTRVSRPGCELAIAYKPIARSGGHEDVLVVVTDITAEVERARAQAEREELAALLLHVSRDRAGTSEFIEETSAVIEALSGNAPMDRARQLRSIHTLKGNFALFDLTSLSGACHALETAMKEECRGPSPSEVALLRGHWRAFAGEVAPLLEHGRDAVVVSKQELHAALSDAHEGFDGRVRARLQTWALQPLGPRLQRIGRQARELAGRLGKPGLLFTVEDNGVRVAAHEYAAFWSAFTHVVRNAVDHGIESPEERRAAQKPPAGRVRLTTVLEDGQLLVELQDDGRGIDWGAVEAIASDRGLPCSTREDLERALMSDALSTRAEVTATSGRGVGLAAVRDACYAYGQAGTIEVESAPGRGTTFRFRLPSARLCLRRSG